MRKVGLIILASLVLLVGGGYLYLSTHQELIARQVAERVELATGRALVWEKAPSLSFYPRLGLEIGKARWGDPKKDPLALDLQGASVRVALVPLLEKRIEVEEVLLSGPRLTISDGADASHAKDAPAGTAQQSVQKGAVNQGAGPVLPPLVISLVQITDGEVVILQKGQNIKVSALNLELKNFEPGKTAKFEAAAMVEDAANGRAAKVFIDSSVLLQNQSLELANFSSNFTQLKGLPLQENIALNGNVTVDLAMLSANISKLEVKTTGLYVKLDGALSQHGGSLNLESKGSPIRLLTNLGSPVTMQDPKALQEHTVRLKATLYDKSVKLDAIEASLDGTHIKGGAYVAFAPLSIQAQFEADSISVNRYLPLGEKKPAGKAPESESSPQEGARQEPTSGKSNARGPKLDIRFALGKLQYNALVFEQIKGQLGGENGRYSLAPASLVVYKVPVQLSGTAHLDTDQYTLNTSFASMPLGSLLKDFAGNDSVEGLLDAQLAYSFSGPDEKAFRRTLSGKGTVNGKNMVVRLGGLPPDWLKIVKNIQTVSIDSLQVHNQATNGVIVVDPITAQGPLVSARGKGTINLPSDALNINIDAMLTALPLPLSITGTLAKPSVALRPVDALRGVLEQVGSTGVDAVGSGAKAITQGVKETGKNLGKGIKDTTKSIKNLLKKK